MKTLKVSTTWLKRTRTLSDAEKGRLFTAMLQYAIDGIAPAISGRESLLWDEAEEQIDKQRDAYTRQQAPNVTRRDEALRRRDEGVTPRNEGVEKASPLSSPTPLSNTPLKERKKTLSKERAKDRNIPTALEQALKDFKDMRNRMHKPMTQLAVDLLVQKLEKLAPGDTDKQVAMIMQSIENGWTGVYELKQERHGRPKSQTFDNYKAEGNACPRLDDIALTLEDEL
ncbi:MAG: hypothetical protein II460_09770 [Oscillospiraceae bacterium]|nr:hypothetical protein [Oscillospiraceae bacterium]